MGRVLPLLLGAISIGHMLGVSAQALDIDQCTNTVRGKFADLGCKDAADAACLCPVLGFSVGIFQCSQNNGGTPDSVYTYLSGGFCAPVAASLIRLDSAGTGVATTSVVPAPTPEPTTSASTPATLTSSSSTILPAIVSSTTSSSSSVASITSALAPASTQSTTTTSSPPSSTSGSPAASTSTVAAAATTVGLSQAAIAGIGVGVGAAVIAVAGILICVLLKARKRKPRNNERNLDISNPLPGSGRYPDSRDDTYRGREPSMEKYNNDIEMTSHRYEDMIPRTQPRTLV